MIDLDVHRMLNPYHLLQSFSEATRYHGKPDQPFTAGPGVLEKAQELGSYLEALGLPFSAAVAHRVVDHMKTHSTWQNVAEQIRALHARIGDEFQQRKVLIVDPSYARYFTGDVPLFGQSVYAKFKTASADIESAGNCLAKSEPNACVFHLMRAMEVAVQKLGTRLNVKITPDKTWGQIAGEMEHKINRMPDDTVAKKRKKDAWGETQTHLRRVGKVWRNNTMHPARNYTQEQARDVLEAVRVFMTDLAAL